MSLLEPSSFQSLLVTARLEDNDLGTATAVVVAHQGTFWLVTKLARRYRPQPPRWAATPRADQSRDRLFATPPAEA
jgi:hypothetical protein